ncbi:MAG TPA: amidohydrolase family protein [Pseudomonadales bacterium]|nr:amidohydrolase family protein [Pseudomonadales bacterium]
MSPALLVLSLAGLPAFGATLAGTATPVTDDGPPLPLEGHTERLQFATNEGSWLSLTVTPDGSTVVFDLLGDLYALPVTGGGATRITSGLAFDAQPTISPDGTRIAFISDRDGADNLWIADLDGSDARPLSTERQRPLVSPAWTPDSTRVIATRRGEPDEFVMYHVAGGSGVVISARGDDGAADPDFEAGVGVTASRDGRYLYYAGSADSLGPVETFPATQIFRLDLHTGAVEQITQGEGGAVRPALSPEGRHLVYGTRHETRTGLRIRDLVTGDDRWLVWPVQRDAQELGQIPSRDHLPGHVFTPDGRSFLFHADGAIQSVRIAGGARSTIPFAADVDIDIGPSLDAPWRVDTGPVPATLIHDPHLSPDGDRLVASVLGHLYAMDARADAPARRLTNAAQREYEPVFSPDGRWIAYVSWSDMEGGHVWRTRANGSGRPQRLTAHPAFYTDLAYGPDGERLFALRGHAWMRQQTFSEFTGLGVPLDLVSLPADGGAVSRLMAAGAARGPHFGPERDRIYLYDGDALFSVALDGSDRRDHLRVTGPAGNRLEDEAPAAEGLRISPDGRHALAWVNKQLHLLPLGPAGATPPVVDVRDGSLPVARITDIGADFFGFSANGGEVHWAIGHRFLRRPVASIAFDAGDADVAMPRDEDPAVRTLDMNVALPRPVPNGSLVLRGGNVIAMAGDDIDALGEVIRDADIIIRGDRIVGVGRRGTLQVPVDARIVDIRDRWVVPGFIDTHAHFEFRTDDVLEPHNWSVAANLAFGVTSGLDVQTSHPDYFTYRDLLAAGEVVGERAFMTGPGIFGSNDFQSFEEVHAYLRRYADHYRTHNIKAYLSGNRQQRQWVVLAAQELGLLPTTEGGGDQKLDLTHAIDGMHGNEHSLPDVPLGRDVVELFARTRTAYTPTLIVQYNATQMREYFFTRDGIHDNAKLQRFTPHNRLDELTARRPGWVRDQEYLFAEGAAEAAKIQRAGGLVGVGGHAELQGLGYHWEMWAFGLGGMRPVEVLRAATIDGARILGAEQDLGSIELGKLADMVILEANPLEDIRNTTAIDLVLQGGRLYDGDTLDERWPETRAFPPFWWWAGDDPRVAPQASE